MSQEVGQTELKAKTQQLLDGPLKHIRAAAIAAALLPLASVAATPASAQTPCTSGGTTIFACGFVFNDANNNGIWDVADVNETPIEGAKVTICVLCNGTDDIATDTGPDGFYSVVAPGPTYTVAVLIPPGTKASPSDVCCDDGVDSDGVWYGTPYSVATGVSANNVATDFGFAPSGFPNPGTGTPGYWKNHPDDWPVDDITIGPYTYTKAQAIAWLGKVGKDKTTTIFASYVAAYLSVQIGNDPGCVSAAMSSAAGWLSLHKVGSNVAGSSPEWKLAEPWHQTMDAYNNGLLCVQHRQ